MSSSEQIPSPNSIDIPRISIEKVGDCPKCENGSFEQKYTPLGWFCGIFCFPCGLICCKSTRKIICSSCGYRKIVTLSE